jgi:osmotically-inducible protein OsmY
LIEQEGKRLAFQRRTAVLETYPISAIAPESNPSSSRVEAEAQRRLRGGSSYALRSVACEFRDGVLSLRGLLPSNYHKQRAEELVQQIDGVQRIQNQITVTEADSSTWLG